MAAQDPNHRGIMVDDLARGRRPLGGLGGVAEFAVDDNGDTVLVGPDGPFSINYVPRASGISDSQLLQNRLNIGGRVVLNANDVYVVDSRLVIPSNTTLDLNGAELIAGAGLNTNMLVNAAYLASALTVTISATSGLATLTYAVDHGRSVGEFVAVAGANEPIFNGVLEVLSIPTSKTLTVLLPEIYTGSATGTILAKLADSNIHVINGKINFNSTAQAGSGLNSMACIFNSVHGVGLDEISGLDGQKYVFLLNNTARTTIGTLNFSTNSDGVHFSGPTLGVDIGAVRGRCDDNMVAFTCSDYAAYAINVGDIRGVKVGHIHAQGGHEPFRAVGLTNCKITDIDIGKITGWNDYATAGAMRITDDSPLLNTNIKSLTIGKIDFYSQADTVLLTGIGSGRVDNFRIGELIRRNPSKGALNIHNSTGGNYGVVQVDNYIDVTASTSAAIYGINVSGSAVNVDELIINGFRWTAGSGTCCGMVVQHTGGTIKNIVVRNLVADGDSAGRCITRSGTGTIGRFSIDTVSCEVNRVYNESTGVGDLTDISINNVSGAASGYLAALASSSKIRLSNIGGTYTTAMVNAGGTSKTPTIYGDNITTTSTHINWGANVGRAVGITLKTDVAKLTSAVRGDIVLDSAANNDPKRFDGAAWTAI